MNDQPTVLVLHPSDELYGADRSLLALVLAVEGIARAVVVLPNDLPYQARLSSVLIARGVKVLVGPLPVVRRRYLNGLGLVTWGMASLRGWIWLVRVARRERAVGIISNSGGILVGVAVAAALRRPHLWYLREIVERPVWFRGVLRTMARLAPGRVAVVSNAVAQWLGRVRGRGPWVLHNGVDIPDRVTPLPDRPTAVFVGRLNDWKGQGVFVEAARASHVARPGALYRLVGGPVPGDTRTATALRSLISEVDPEGRFIEWVGEVPDARAAMRDAWIVVVPSLRPDPFPNVVLEAMSEARAVVGSSAGGITETVVGGTTGILCRPGDRSELAAAMTELLGNREEAVRYGEAGRARAQALFSREAFVGKWRALFSAWLAGSPIRDRHRPASAAVHDVVWDETKVSRFWDFASSHGTADYFSSVFARDLADEIVKVARPDGIVVDLGCGVGDLMLELRRHGLTVRGVDNSPDSIAVARTRLSDLDAEDLKVGSLTALPLPDDSVDTAVLIEVVEHMSENDLRAMLAEVMRVLRPGGHLFLSTPNDEDLTAERLPCPRCGARFHRMQHVRRWTSDSMVAFLQSGGFRFAQAYERRLAGESGLDSRLRRRWRTLRDRQVRCPDCGAIWNRSLALSRLAGGSRRRPRPHLLAVATRP